MTEVSVEPTPYTRGESIWTAYEDEGLVILCILTTAPEGESVNPVSVSEFVHKNTISHPVLADPDHSLRGMGLRDPVEVLIGPDMTVAAMGDLPISDVWIRNNLAKFFED